MKTLILSDLHFGHKASSAGKMLDGLRALAGNYDRVVLNGDALDYAATPAIQDELKAQIKEACSSREGPPEFLTGNHDPDVSPAAWVYLPEPAALVFHGDCIADCTHPAKRHDQLQASMLLEFWNKLGGRPAKFEELARLYRETQARFLRLYPPDSIAQNKFWYLARTLCPPKRALHILRYWWNMPRLVACLAATFDQPVKHIVVGHSHRPGHWRMNGTTIYNTGSFMPFSKAYAVSVEGAEIRWQPLAGLLGHPGQTGRRR